MTNAAAATATKEKKPKQAPVQIGADAHAILKRIVARRNSVPGEANTTIRQLIEDALIGYYPEDFAAKAAKPTGKLTRQAVAAAIASPATSASSSDSILDPQAEEDALFGRVIGAAYAGGSPQEQTAAIEALRGAVGGSFDQQIKLKDLAYHLRGSNAAVGSLRELVADYENAFGPAEGAAI